MKTYLNAILFLLVFQLGYSQLTNPSNEITNPSNRYTGHEGALINDFIKLEFDKENSKITFDFISENTSGTIGGLEYKISFNPDDPDNAYFKGSALVTTLDTDNFLRDGHLMWGKFFYKSKYPKIEFSSTQVVHFGDNNYKVIGNLTIKGTTKEVIINFMLDTDKLQGKTTIYTSDFGVNIHDEREENALNIVFDFPLLK